MLTQITETQIDNATHALALTLENMGIFLGDEIKCSLNDTLSEFIYERCSVEVVPDDEGVIESKVQILKTRNVSCNANEEITFEVNKAEWEVALSDLNDNKVDALQQLQDENKVVRTDYNAEVQGISAEFDVDVEEI
jgi:hypothetical protein